MLQRYPSSRCCLRQPAAFARRSESSLRSAQASFPASAPGLAGSAESVSAMLPETASSCRYLASLHVGLTKSRSNTSTFVFDDVAFSGRCGVDRWLNERRAGFENDRLVTLLPARRQAFAGLGGTREDDDGRTADL